MFAEKVLSGMRPTGRLHLGHYHGVLKNWVKLQANTRACSSLPTGTR
jgi:tryptophanyl-tRNA synthetase